MGVADPYRRYKVSEVDGRNGSVGDCYDGYLVRMEVMRQSLRTRRQCLDRIPGGADNEGNEPVDEIIRKNGEAGYLSTLPVRGMVNRLLEIGLPAEVSNSAGTYLCNNVMYEALHFAATERPEMKSGFLHIPASHELAIQHGRIPSWSHEDLKKGVATCIEVLAADESN